MQAIVDKRYTIPQSVLLQLDALRGVPLTDRELDVVRAVLAGYTSHKTIAAALTISPRTAQTHLWHIYHKTGARNMVDLALMALGCLDGYVNLPKVLAASAVSS